MMKKKPYLGVTDLEFFGDQLYKIEGEDLYMIATSEHPMAAKFMDEVLDQSQLPVKFVGNRDIVTFACFNPGLFVVAKVVNHCAIHVEDYCPVFVHIT